MRFVFAVFVASALCALVIGWGLSLLGFVPFFILSNIVLFNNFVSSMIFAPLLLVVIYPRVAKGRLLYHNFIDPQPKHSRPVRYTGLILLTVATVSGLVVGNLLATGKWTPELFTTLGWVTETKATEVGVGLLPFIALACLGLALL
jgi:energy-coupling factor transport system substrate-specific component